DYYCCSYRSATTYIF
nr:immunoglobulin light chain junction region [Macaca mulatta]